MRLLKLELKRILTSRRTIILLSIALLLGVVMAILPIYYEGIDRPNDDGTKTILSGVAAIQYKRPYYETISGEVTPDMVADALAQYQQIMEEYQAESTSDLPLEVLVKDLLPIRPLFRGLNEIYSNPVTGAMPDLLTLDPEEVRQTYYEKCTEHLQIVMQMEQENHPSAQKNAAAIYAKVDTPFYYISGMSRDAFDYTQFYIFFLAVACVAIAAPMFSGEYQNGSDSILRCTKLGRKELALTKVLAACIVFVLIYVVGMCLHLLILDTAFGTECLKESFQLLYSIISLPNMNLWQTQILLAICGLIIVLACACMTMLLSAKCKDSLTVLLISAAILILPIFMGGMLDTNWISSCLLPSSGIGMQNNLLYQIANFYYLHLGSISIWTPYAIVTAAVIEIPAFLVLAVKLYCKHQVT